METGLITNENKFIAIPYYEIGDFAEKICEQYIQKSELNKIEFEEFAKNYTFFKPHLDFLLFHLGYKMKNPLLHENSTWEVIKGKLQLKSETGSVFDYSPVRDDILQITYVNPEKIEDSLIDVYGRKYRVPKEFGLHHEDVYELVINQYLIYDKELYKIYEEYMNSGITIGTFGRNVLGFHQICVYDDHSGYIVYCSDFYNSYLDTVCKRISEIYPKIEMLPYHIHTEESLEIANKCIERVGELDENRRLRF